MLDFLQYIAGLVLVLGLLFGFAYILRRAQSQGLIPGFPGQAGERRMRVTESLILDPRRRVLIVEIDRTEHVLLLGPERETLLDTRPAKPAPPAFEPEMPGQGSEPQ